MTSGSELLKQLRQHPDRAAFLATLDSYELRRIARALRLNESNGSRFYRMDENIAHILEALKERP